ncbi:hypothetical protein H5410_046470 [Solanum commersonii]|uniref:Uncharacterized protein n=1 Tax=Solanum commersonii TaxID=4109 RepID=A0A9J5XFL7_SOLCO|nr:hypothetical protein H5410_046470 [Solanum commersonii]
MTLKAAPRLSSKRSVWQDDRHRRGSRDDSGPEATNEVRLSRHTFRNHAVLWVVNEGAELQDCIVGRRKMVNVNAKYGYHLRMDSDLSPMPRRRDRHVKRIQSCTQQPLFQIAGIDDITKEIGNLFVGHGWRRKG